MARRTVMMAAATLAVLAVAANCTNDSEGPHQVSTGAGGTVGVGGAGIGGAPDGSGGALPGSGGITLTTGGVTGTGGGFFIDTSGIGQVVDISGDGVPDPVSAASVILSEAQIAELDNAACTGWSAEPEPRVASIMMVVDASSSMDAAPPEGGGRTKWEVTRDALIEAVNLLEDDVELGLLAYPNKRIAGTAGDASMCVAVDAMVPTVPLGVDNHRQVIIDALNDVETNQCTPTHDAYNAAIENFRNSTTNGEKYILLMTDGQPTLYQGCEPGNCNAAETPDSEQPVIDAVAAAWTNDDIKTFVLGCPGSEAHSVTGLDNRWWLSQAAEVGQTAAQPCSHTAEPYCHFDMTTGGSFAEELQAVLATIVGQVVSCDYNLPPPPPGENIDTNAINFILRPSTTPPLLLVRMQDPSCTQGWYLDPTTQKVRLCSDTCEMIQADSLARTNLYFGCDSLVPLQ
ncbi:MAG: VWA domain-containing protein [Polyangiaceae bacterium]|nr:VWA domain-containing protein [Polyangiaceae bacterium]